MKVHFAETCAGFIGFAWTAEGVAALTFPFPHPPQTLVELERKTRGDSRGAAMVPPAPGETAYGLEQALQDYFAGNSPDLERFAVDFSPYTSFGARVLQAARRIPYGSVLSYGGVAALAGRPRAYRAVGRVMGANRTPYLVPCHRVIKSDGSLGGFGGGEDWKRWLLSLEGNLNIY